MEPQCALSLSLSQEKEEELGVVCKFSATIFRAVARVDLAYEVGYPSFFERLCNLSKCKECIIIAEVHAPSVSLV
jgi:hypothetical protein